MRENLIFNGIPESELTTLHKSMMASRNRWLDAGRPRGRNHNAFSEYKAAKRHFRRAHRQASETFIKTQLDEIDRLAEVDQRLFWHHVNHRRKRSCNAAGSNINFDGRNVFNEREITNEWANYCLPVYSNRITELRCQFQTNCL